MGVKHNVAFSCGSIISDKLCNFAVPYLNDVKYKIEYYYYFKNFLFNNFDFIF